MRYDDAIIMMNISTQYKKTQMNPHPSATVALENLHFDNQFIREMPADSDTENYCRQVFSACYSFVEPTPVKAPKLIHYSKEVAESLDLSPESCESELFAQVFTGNALLNGMQPYALCYGGHQFGNWAGQLGDGRAINLGEVLNQHGQRFTLQLKGAGQTPYSRTADGLAVLRSSVREFLCSEAMHHLGIPTTRALSLTLTGEKVMRDMFYDGRSKLEPGAVVCRVAPSFTRFGSFQIFDSRKEHDLLQKLVDYTIRTDFPHLGEPCREVYLAWFSEVCLKTAELIVHWQRVGFVHGVMNTDNMSILGLTIDYGPYGWLENYDPRWTPNTTDAAGRRYCFGNQPQIGLWNLTQLASSIFSLIGDVAPLKQALALYGEHFAKGWNEMMAAKLGFKEFQAETDEKLLTELLQVLQLVETDMTIFYRKLANFEIQQLDLENLMDDELIAPIFDAYYQPEKLIPAVEKRIADWLRLYLNRAREDGIADSIRREKMNAVNPQFVLRNYLAQLAIDKADTGDFSMIAEILEVLRNPYAEQEGKEEFAQKRPDWARQRAGCSMLSCSS
jgi:serine/tyrosine/threonine adenylyltransferase